jgi:predicted transposase/invertase (TIGR01784 family)
LDCFEDPKLARETLLTPQLLVDLSTIPDEELASHREIALMELLQKHIAERDLVELVRYLAAPELRQYLSTDQFKSVIQYLKEAGHSQDYKEFLHQFRQPSSQPTDQAIMQTLGDYLEEQGLQKGIQQTRLQYAKEMLLAQIDANIVKRITHLSDQELADLLH